MALYKSCCNGFNGNNYNLASSKNEAIENFEPVGAIAGELYVKYKNTPYFQTSSR